MKLNFGEGAGERRDAEVPAFRTASAYHEQVVEPRRTPIHAREWIASLERHVPKELWHKPIDRIEAPELLDAVARVSLNTQAPSIYKELQIPAESLLGP